MRTYFWLLFACIIYSFPSMGRAEDAPAKITYDDHIRPIFRQYCLKCHDEGAKKGDLALDSYAATLVGGGSGEVVFEADLDNSRLWHLVNHEDEPAMPPNADKLPEDKLALIRGWIEGGTLENSGSVAKAPKKSGLAMVAPTTGGKPEGPAAMPETLYREPILYTDRAAAVTAVAASPWAPLIAVAGQRQVSFCHSETGVLLGIVPFLEGTPHVLRFSRDGSLLLVAGGRGAALGLATLYDVRTGSRLVAVGDELDEVLAADVHPNLALIALGGPQRIVRTFATADGSPAYEIRKHTDWITAVAFSPDGKHLVTTDRSGGVFLWESETGREVAAMRGHNGAVTSAAWRGDSQVVATSGADGSVRLWNPEEGKQIKTWAAHGGGATVVRFAADGRLVTAGRDRIVKLWKPDGAAIKNLATFDDIALDVCITYDGKRVAAGDFTGDVRLLDIESAEKLATLEPNPRTLAMRTAAATAATEQAIKTLEATASAKQEADKAIVAAETEAARLTGELVAAQNKLVEVQTGRDAANKELAAKNQAADAVGLQMTQATETLVAASAQVQAAEAELAQARQAKEDTTAAEKKLAEATSSVKQSIVVVESVQVSMKNANLALAEATKQMGAADATVVAAEQGVQVAQSAVTEFGKKLSAAKEIVTTKAQEVVARQQAVEAAKRQEQAAKEEELAFASAVEKLTAAIGEADARVVAAMEKLNVAKQSQAQSEEELTAHKAVVDEAAKKLAEAKAEYEGLKQLMDEAQAALQQIAQTTDQAANAHQQSEAKAAQSKADKELFERSQEVRKAYSK